MKIRPRSRGEKSLWSFPSLWSLPSALIALALPLHGTAIAAAPDNGDLQQTAARQEQIRDEARQVVSRLDEVIAEYTRNGLASGEDFRTLKDLRAALDSLTEEEMEQVVALLKQAAGDPAQMTKAYAGQKEISVRLKQILAAHERQQDIDALAVAVRQLAGRQSANLATATDSRQLAAQDNSANGQAAVAASRQAQQSEQDAISAEVTLVAGKLGQISSDARYKDAAAQLARMPTEAASEALGAGRMDDAVTAETAARDQLDAIARALIPTGGPEPKASPTPPAGGLADLAREQRTLLDQTARLNAALKKAAEAESPEATNKAMEDQMKDPASALAKALAASGITPASPPDQIRRAPAMKAFLDARAAQFKRDEQTARQQLAALSATEAALAAKAQKTREELQTTAKAAAAPMANALTQMNSAQEALAEGDGEQAAQEEADAADQLAQAQRLAAQSPPPAPPPAGEDSQSPQSQDLANLEKAAAGLEAVIQLQQQLRLDTEKAVAQARAGASKAKQFARVQAGIRKDAQTVRQGLTPSLPDAAKALDQADAAMEEAGQELGDGGIGQAEPAQQTALDALYQAQDALANRMQNLGPPPALGRDDAEAALEKAQSLAASAQGAMASAAPGDDATQHAATELAQAARAAAKAGQQPQALPQDARGAIRIAEQALAAAAAAAAAGQGKQAAAQAAQAGQALEAAQAALGEAQAGIAGLSSPASGAGPPGSKGPGPNSGTAQSATGASEKNWNDQPGAAIAATEKAPGPAAYLGLPDRDRAAIRQSQSEKYPQEYGSQIEQYMQSLAADPAGK